MALDTRLLAVLACPVDKGPLYHLAGDSHGEGEALYNPRLRKKYLVQQGIPVMLPDEAVDVVPVDAELLDARIASGELAPTFSA
jgi:uncharacterized protein YbaR (Trm112 family)